MMHFEKAKYLSLNTIKIEFPRYYIEIIITVMEHKRTQKDWMILEKCIQTILCSYNGNKPPMNTIFSIRQTQSIKTI